MVSRVQSLEQLLKLAFDSSLWVQSEKPLNTSCCAYTEEYSGCLYEVIMLNNRTFASNILMLSQKCFPCFCQRNVILCFFIFLNLDDHVLQVFLSLFGTKGAV